jgi:hypothetical protein
VLADLGTLAWTGDDGLDRREIDYLVEVSGDLGDPQLEAELHHDPRWVTLAEARSLLDGTHPSDELVWTVVERAFQVLASEQPRR